MRKKHNVAEEVSENETDQSFEDSSSVPNSSENASTNEEREPNQTTKDHSFFGHLVCHLSPTNDATNEEQDNTNQKEETEEEIEPMEHKTCFPFFDVPHFQKELNC